MLLSSLLLFIISGLIAGTLSGLLGLGGGLTLVPLLSLALGWSHIPSNLAMHLTIGTSMGCIFINSISASWQRIQAGHFDIHLFKRLVFGLIVGVIIGCSVGHFLSGNTLRYIFIFVVLAAILKTLQKTFSAKKHASTRPPEKLPGRIISAAISCFTGFQGAISGGGAALITMPFLSSYHYAMKKSAAQASALSTVIGLSASISYIILGWNAPGLPSWSLGYVYLPALIPVVIVGFFGAKLGIKISQVTSDKSQQIVFILFLIIVICTMISKAMHTIH